MARNAPTQTPISNHGPKPNSNPTPRMSRNSWRRSRTSPITAIHLRPPPLTLTLTPTSCPPHLKLWNVIDARRNGNWITSMKVSNSDSSLSNIIQTKPKVEERYREG